MDYTNVPVTATYTAAYDVMGKLMLPCMTQWPVDASGEDMVGEHYQSMTSRNKSIRARNKLSERASSVRPAAPTQPGCYHLFAHYFLPSSIIEIVYVQML